MITKNQLLGRDENGNLVPTEVYVPSLKDTVLMTPVSRGEILRIGAKLKSGEINPLSIDVDYVKEHLVSPKLSPEEIEKIPNNVLKEIVEALLVVSGVLIKDGDTPQNAVAEAEAELRKK